MFKDFASRARDTEVVQRGHITVTLAFIVFLSGDTVPPCLPGKHNHDAGSNGLAWEVYTNTDSIL